MPAAATLKPQQQQLGHVQRRRCAALRPPSAALAIGACGRRQPHHHQQQQQQHASCAPTPSAAASAGAPSNSSSSKRSVAAAAGQAGVAAGNHHRGVQLAAIVGAALTLGVANRVLYRLALVPLKDYVFFLAQAQNVLYLIAYYGLLLLRIRRGLVTPEMLATPKRMFVLTGCCEALAQLMMMSGAAHLPGALLPLLMQTVLLYNLVLSCIVFRTRPTLPQVTGVLAVLAGVCIASLPPGGGAAGALGPASAEVPLLPLLLVTVSFLFPAVATICKERIFRDAAARLGGGRQLDVLVVNAWCSTAQAGFLLLLLPVSCALKGLSLRELPAYLVAGATCLAGSTPACGSDCGGAPLLPLIYIAVNIAFNIVVMLLVRSSSGAVGTALVMSCLVPLTAGAFALLAPLLAPWLQPTVLGPNFWLGTAVLMAGLLLYNARAFGPAFSRFWGALWRRQPKLAS